MPNTSLHRTPRAQLSPEAGAAWDMLDGLTGEPAFIEAMASAPELLDLVMNQFYGRIFFGGRVEERYKQLLRLRLSLAHGCRSCNLQNVVGTRAAGFSDEAIASIEGDRASLFVGCGIVGDSEPEREWAESGMKLQSLASALGRLEP